MKISKNYEKAMSVIIILATQKNHSPIKSTRLSEILEVSDSSLKKILRKLVTNELIKSTASKDGGFELKKEITKISLLDVLIAIEGKNFIQLPLTHLSQKIFEDFKYTQRSESLVLSTIEKAENDFASNLEKIYISDLIAKETVKHGLTDWNKEQGEK